MVQLLKKNKTTAGGFHSWWESNVGIIRKPNNVIKKVTKLNKENNKMKSILKSKLFWLGVINVLVGVLNYVGGALENGTAITANGLLIIILRAITREEVYFIKK